MFDWLDYLLLTLFWLAVFTAVGDSSKTRHTRRVTLANKRAETARYELRRAEIERDIARIRAEASPFRPRGHGVVVGPGESVINNTVIESATGNFVRKV